MVSKHFNIKLLEGKSQSIQASIVFPLSESHENNRSRKKKNKPLSLHHYLGLSREGVNKQQSYLDSPQVRKLLPLS